MSRRVVVHPNHDVLAAAAAARVLTTLLDLQSQKSPVHWVLTGGTVGIGTLAEMRKSPVVTAVDWTGVHIWWGDERFVPAGDGERNETQARAALLDFLIAECGLPEENIHPMLAPGTPGIDSAEQAAEAYCAELARFAGDGAGVAGDGAEVAGAGAEVAGDGADTAARASAPAASTDKAAPAVPAFDLLLLGMGPDIHVASLFPGHAGLAATGAAAIAIHNSPKPPPTRVSLTFDAINQAQRVWIVAGGAEKAEAVQAVLDGKPVAEAPAAGVAGKLETLLLLDANSAG